MITRKYNPNKNVLQASRERISYIFDEFKDIFVSISGGKDSTVLLSLALQEAERRNRKVHVFFLDQEAEYQASIDLIRKIMKNKYVIPEWYQVPIYMTNATSYSEYFLYAWGEGEKWIREKEPNSYHEIKEEYPKRFYEFFDYIESKNKEAAYLVGLRAEESITRFRAVTKNAGYNGLRWSTITTKGVNKFYPIYDWTWNSVWRFIYDYNIEYNKMYDLMFWDNYSIYKMRVSNLIHEKSFNKCLQSLPKFEPDTYDALCKRIGGIATASRYVSEKLMFNNKKLPTHYKCWKDFRDFLLENNPNEEHKKKFIARFEKQDKNERIYQAQVGQLLINDYENSRSFDTKKEEKTKKIIEKWKNLL
jgi:predicted phosphoadenosine phosphosulfate sulfurtransferase